MNKFKNVVPLNDFDITFLSTYCIVHVNNFSIMFDISLCDHYDSGFAM